MSKAPFRLVQSSFSPLGKKLYWGLYNAEQVKSRRRPTYSIISDYVTLWSVMIIAQ